MPLTNEQRTILDRGLAAAEAGSGLYPARLLANATTDDLLKLAKSRALDPSVFEERAPFFWRCEISSGRLDSYFSRMQPSSLRNYASEATAGVAFLLGHNWRSAPIGQSLTGHYFAGVAEGETQAPARVEADFYTVRGLRPNGEAGTDADHLIDGIRSGTQRDVSIGFHGGRYICSICQRDMWQDWDCPHYPGVEYPVLDRAGKPTGETVVAEAHIEDAHLSEVSAVYDGATPGAAVLKAYRAAEAGRLRPETAAVMRDRYRLLLPGLPRVAVPGVGPESVKETGVDIRELLLKLGAPVEADAEWVVKEMGSLRDQVTRLTPLADDGTAYRRDLVDDAIKAGVRAHGNDFAVETYKGILDAAPLATIKRMTADWEATATKVLPAGRLSSDGPVDGAPAAAATTVPDAIYRM